MYLHTVVLLVRVSTYSNYGHDGAPLLLGAAPPLLAASGVAVGGTSALDCCVGARLAVAHGGRGSSAPLSGGQHNYNASPALLLSSSQPE